MFACKASIGDVESVENMLKLLVMEDDAPALLAITDRPSMLAIEDGLTPRSSAPSTLATLSPDLASFPIFEKLKRRREEREMNDLVLVYWDYIRVWFADFSHFSILCIKNTSQRELLYIDLLSLGGGGVRVMCGGNHEVGG